MQAKFYNFNKRVNSSAVPTNPGATMDIYFKAPTSVHTPIIRINAKTFNYNYVYIDELGTYYKITDIIAVNDSLWEARLEHDLLATFRQGIIDSAQYVNYAWSGYNNMIPDTRCAMYEPQLTEGAIVDIPRISEQGGLSSGSSYAVTVLNTTPTDGRFTCTYMLTENELNSLAAELIDIDFSWSSAIKIVNNPIDAIVRILWLPINFNESAGFNRTNIVIGAKQLNTKGYKMVSASGIIQNELTLNIPWPYNDFRRLEPYAKLSLWLPMYGAVALNASAFAALNTLSVKYSIDVYTGDISFIIGSVSADNRQLINYNIGVNIEIAQLFANISAIASDISSVAGGVLTAAGALSIGNAPGAISGIANAAVGAVNLTLDAQAPTKSVKGSIQGRSLWLRCMGLQLFISWYSTEDPDDYALIKGRPILSYEPLSNYLGGYIQTSNASVTLSGALANEEAEVNALLDQGIYLE